TACHGTEAARKAAVVAAKVIAATGVDLFTDKKLIQQAKSFFLEVSGGKPYVSPLLEQTTAK
ncbi:MAG: amidohydrolase, partial [bacterium]